MQQLLAIESLQVALCSPALRRVDCSRLVSNDHLPFLQVVLSGIAHGNFRSRELAFGRHYTANEQTQLPDFVFEASGFEAYALLERLVELSQENDRSIFNTLLIGLTCNIFNVKATDSRGAFEYREPCRKYVNPADLICDLYARSLDLKVEPILEDLGLTDFKRQIISNALLAEYAEFKRKRKAQQARTRRIHNYTFSKHKYYLILSRYDCPAAEQICRLQQELALNAELLISHSDIGSSAFLISGLGLLALSDPRQLDNPLIPDLFQLFELSGGRLDESAFALSESAQRSLVLSLLEAQQEGGIRFEA